MFVYTVLNKKLELYNDVHGEFGAGWMCAYGKVVVLIITALRAWGFISYLMAGIYEPIGMTMYIVFILVGLVAWFWFMNADTASWYWMIVHCFLLLADFGILAIVADNPISRFSSIIWFLFYSLNTFYYFKRKPFFDASIKELKKTYKEMYDTTYAGADTVKIGDMCPNCGAAALHLEKVTEEKARVDRSAGWWITFVLACIFTAGLALLYFALTDRESKEHRNVPYLVCDNCNYAKQYI